MVININRKREWGEWTNVEDEVVDTLFTRVAVLNYITEYSNIITVLIFFSVKYLSRYLRIRVPVYRTSRAYRIKKLYNIEK